MPERIQLSRRKGFRLPPNTVVVSRPSKWGNPFKRQEGLDGDYRNAGWCKAAAVDLFRDWLRYLDRFPYPCHASVLLRIANEPQPRKGEGHA